MPQKSGEGYSQRSEFVRKRPDQDESQPIKKVKKY